MSFKFTRMIDPGAYIQELIVPQDLTYEHLMTARPDLPAEGCPSGAIVWSKRLDQPPLWLECNEEHEVGGSFVVGEVTEAFAKMFWPPVAILIHETVGTHCTPWALEDLATRISVFFAHAIDRRDTWKWADGKWDVARGSHT